MYVFYLIYCLDAGLSESSRDALIKIMKIQPPWLPDDRKRKPPKAKDDKRPYDLSRWKPRIVEFISVTNYLKV